MGLHVLIASLIFVVSHQTHANINITEGMADPNNIFYISNGRAQVPETIYMTFAGKTVGEHFSSVCSSINNTDTLPIVQCTGVQTIDVVGSTATGICDCTKDDTGFSEGPYYPDYIVGVYEDTAYNCDLDNYPEYTLKVTEGSTTICYNPDLLDAADTCSTSPTNNEFLLPDNGTTYANICHTKDDGSRCAYTNSGDGYYQRDFETNCYLQDGIAYDGTEVQPASEGSCMNDSGFLICTEEPTNLCTGDSCLAGCGSVTYQGTTSFVCYTSDTDNDTIPDYADPDIDGDGIANNLDLDADGDGYDDPDYSDVVASDGTSITSEALEVNIDLSTVEALIAETNTKLNTTNSTLSDIDTTTSEIKTAIEDAFEVEDNQGQYEDEATVQSDIDLAEAELEAQIATIRAEFDTLFSFNVPTGAFQNCVDIAMIGGAAKQTCFSDFHDELEIIAIVIWFMFVFVSILILFR